MVALFPAGVEGSQQLNESAEKMVAHHKRIEIFARATAGLGGSAEKALEATAGTRERGVTEVLAEGAIEVELEKQTPSCGNKWIRNWKPKEPGNPGDDKPEPPQPAKTVTARPIAKAASALD